MEIPSFLFKAGGCATVALFYFNLRGLYRSPKVFFDTTCHSAAQVRWWQGAVILRAGLLECLSGPGRLEKVGFSPQQYLVKFSENQALSSFGTFLVGIEILQSTEN